MMNIVQNETHNKRYRKKYHFMKLKIKSLIIENAALCDEVAKIQEDIQIVKEERKFLLRKLLEYENDADIVQTFYKNEQAAMSNGTRSKPKQRRNPEDGGKNVTM